MSVAMGVSNPQLECELVGTRFRDNIDQTAAAIAYAKERGVDLKFADSSAFSPEIIIEGGGSDE